MNEFVAVGNLPECEGYIWLQQSYRGWDILHRRPQRSAQGADLLVTDPDCRRAFSVQVKTNAATFGFWLMGKKNVQMRSPSLIYVFVNLRKDRTEYFVVPSAVVADNIQVSQSGNKSPDSTDVVLDALAEEEAKKTNTWYAFYYKVAHKYENNWRIFEEESV